MGQAGMASN